MFESLLRRLLQPAPEPLPALDGRRALAALLVRLARADGQYSAAEATRIDHVLAARYGLVTREAQILRQDGEGLEAEAPDTVRFTRALKEAVPYEDRLGVVEALWAVALSDGRRSDEEAALVRLVAPLLGVSDPDSGLARQRVVEQRTKGPGQGNPGLADRGPWSA